MKYKLENTDPKTCDIMRERLEVMDESIKHERITIQALNDKIQSFIRLDLNQIEHEKERKKLQMEDELARCIKRIEVIREKHQEDKQRSEKFRERMDEVNEESH